MGQLTGNNAKIVHLVRNQKHSLCFIGSVTLVMVFKPQFFHL